MVTDADRLYGELKGDLQALSSPLFQFAEQQVRKRGAFLPFGAGLTNQGRVSLHAASPGRDAASSPEVLSLLHEGLRSAVTEQDLSAVAVLWLKTLLIQCAWAAVQGKNSYLRSQFYRIRARRGPKKAIGAVAASMLTAIYYILRDDVEYRDLGPHYLDTIDRTRLSRRLVRRLENMGYHVELKGAA
jgi:hypothetical protein